jgi:NAD(P)-dependent dehydrogenase (short-subunit alcohol dehydrogenase family)
MDPRGKVVVVTGATSGLGQAFAIDAARAGARVLITGRDAGRAQETVDAARAAGGSAEAILGDVSTRAGVHAVAVAVLAKAPRIDVLVNNAGGSFKQPSKTTDGIDATFAVNTFGAYLLERELHGAIAATKGRVVNLATGFLDNYPLDPDDLISPKKFSSLAVYARSKQAVVMMTVEQAHRFAPEGVTVVSLSPGVIMGTRFGGGQPKIAQMIGGPIMRAIGLGATLEEATRRFNVAAFGDVPTGSYIHPGMPAPLPRQSNDAAVRARVLALLDGLVAPQRAAGAA